MRDFRRYATGVLLLVLAVVLLIVGVNFIRNIFKGDKPSDKQTQTSKKVDLLSAPQNDKTVQYTIVGPVTGDEDHRSIRIKINRDFRTIEVLQGYDNNILKSEEIANTLEGYEAFVAALNGAGFTKTISPDGRGEEKQACPLGRTFVYEVSPAASDTFRSWSNSCGSKQGTFTGNPVLIRTLFQRQIPEYDKYTTDVRLG